MSKLIDKFPPFVVPVVQTLVAAGLAALVAWLSAQGFVKQEMQAQKALNAPVCTCAGK